MKSNFYIPTLNNKDLVKSISNPQVLLSIFSKTCIITILMAANGSWVISIKMKDINIHR